MGLATLLTVLTALRQLRKREHWTYEQLAAHQAQALSQLRAYAYEHSPFYQRFHQGLMDHPLNDLPVLTKTMLMEHFDDLVTDRHIRLEDIRAHMTTLQGDQQYLDRYWVTATSGSTGQPGIFLFNRAEWATVIASFGRGQEWGGLKVDLRYHRKMAVVSSTSSLHMSFRIGLTVQSPWISTLRLAAAEPLSAIVQQLNDFQPDILIAYASMARILAEEQHAGRLQMRPPCVKGRTRFGRAGQQTSLSWAICPGLLAAPLRRTAFSASSWQPMPSAYFRSVPRRISGKMSMQEQG